MADVLEKYRSFREDLESPVAELESTAGRHSSPSAVCDLPVSPVDFVGGVRPTALAEVDDEPEQSFLEKVIQDGWLADGVVEKMRKTQEVAFDMATDEDLRFRKPLVTLEAIHRFTETVSRGADLIKPTNNNVVTVNNAVILDALRNQKSGE